MTTATRGQSVTRQIREAILDGTHGPGARMNEIELANALAVSRTPVRGALAALAAEGLLEYMPNCGYVVRSYSLRDIEGVYEVRSMLEGLAARQAAERGLPDAQRGILHRLLADAEALERAGRWDDEAQATWTRVNGGFHEAILEAAGNLHLRELMHKSRSIPMLGAIRFRWHDIDVVREANRDHAEIFDAIVNGQAVRAEALAREHIYRGGRRLIGNMRRLESAPSAPGRNARRAA